MPLVLLIKMLYTEEQSDVILNHGGNVSKRVEKHVEKTAVEPAVESNIIIKQPEKNPNIGNRTTFAEKVFLGTLAGSGVSCSAIEKEFNISREQVNCYRNGRTNNLSNKHHVPHPELEAAVKGSLDVVTEKAVDLLMRSIGVITDEKLAKASARDASSIAANASRIINNCTPKEVSDNRVQIVMYAPRQKELREFDSIEI